MAEVCELREVTLADAPDVLELVTLCEIAETGEALCTLDELRVELAEDAARGVAVDRVEGGLAAYAWASLRPGLGMVMGEVCIRPGGDWSVAPRLVDWLQASARELGASLPVHCFARVANPAMCRLFESFGGTVVRRYFRMEIAVDETLEPPTLPPGVAILGVSTEADLRTMHAIIEAAFVDHYAHESQMYDEWRRRSVGGSCGDLGLWWLVTVDGVPAAGVYCSTGSAGGYVDMLGTLRSFRGRGLGTLLLRTAFAEFARRGHSKVSLSVDATNPTGALALYESVGMTVAHEDLRFELPPLRPEGL